MKSKKAQLSIEFLILLSFILIFFLIVLAVVNQRSAITNQEITNLYAKSVADQLSQEINSIYLGGDGLSKSVNLPEQLQDNTDYYVNILPDSKQVRIFWTREDNEQFYSAPLVNSNMAGMLINLSGQVNLTNNNGIVTIN
jgi:hypothetical protein